MASGVTGFYDGKKIAAGDRDEVAWSIKAQLSEHDGAVFIFDDLSSRVVDLDYRNIESAYRLRIYRHRTRPSRHF